MTKKKSHHLDRRAMAIAEGAEAQSPNELLSTPALADWFGVSVQWVEIGRHKGYGPPFVRLGSRRIRYRRDAVLAWLKERTHASTAEYAEHRPAGTPEPVRPNPIPRVRLLSRRSTDTDRGRVDR
jgi:predicted DNA-binding transcriptional regulator AlpA